MLVCKSVLHAAKDPPQIVRLVNTATLKHVCAGLVPHCRLQHTEAVWTLRAPRRQCLPACLGLQVLGIGVDALVANGYLDQLRQGPLYW